MTCKKEMQAAVKYKESGAVGAGFNRLGRVAGRRSSRIPKWPKGMADLEPYVDEEEFKPVMSAAE